jgi:hypothetical protein
MSLSERKVGVALLMAASKEALQPQFDLVNFCLGIANVRIARMQHLSLRKQPPHPRSQLQAGNTPS